MLIAVRLRARGALIVQVCGGQSKWRRATQAHCEQQRVCFFCFHGETPFLVVHPVFGLLFTEEVPAERRKVLMQKGRVTVRPIAIKGGRFKSAYLPKWMNRRPIPMTGVQPERPDFDELLRHLSSCRHS